MAASTWAASAARRRGWRRTASARWRCWNSPNSAWKPSGASRSRIFPRSLLWMTRATTSTTGWNNAFCDRPHRPHRDEREERRDHGGLVPARAGHGTGGFRPRHPQGAEIRRPEDQPAAAGGGRRILADGRVRGAGLDRYLLHHRGAAGRGHRPPARLRRADPAGAGGESRRAGHHHLGVLPRSGWEPGGDFVLPVAEGRGGHLEWKHRCTQIRRGGVSRWAGYP